MSRQLEAAWTYVRKIAVVGTKAEAVAIARRATRYGWFEKNGKAWVTCPTCNAKVYAVKYAWERFNRGKLVDFLVDHLMNYCGAPR